MTVKTPLVPTVRKYSMMPLQTFHNALLAAKSQCSFVRLNVRQSGPGEHFLGTSKNPFPMHYISEIQPYIFCIARILCSITIAVCSEWFSSYISTTVSEIQDCYTTEQDSRAKIARILCRNSVGNGSVNTGEQDNGIWPHGMHRIDSYKCALLHSIHVYGYELLYFAVGSDRIC